MFAIAIVSCSSDDDGGDSAPAPAPERFDTAAAFVDALDAGGVACENFEEDEPTRSVGFPEGISAGTCAGGLDVASSAGALEIDLYATEADAKEAITATLDALACNDNAPEYDFLRGANWTVLGGPDDVDAVRAAMGGEVTTFCD